MYAVSFNHAMKLQSHPSRESKKIIKKRSSAVDMMLRKLKQESRGVARKPSDAAAVLFG